MRVLNVGQGAVIEAVRFAPALGLTYLNNPKVACTSVKSAMWLQHDAVAGERTFKPGATDPHRMDIAPWRDLMGCDRGKLAASVKFTIVRQPHTRLLSAYLSKRKNPPGDPFVKWCNRRLGGVPETFSEFVRKALQVPEHERDRHVRPQWINVLWPHIRFDFVGRLEDISPVERFLFGHGVKLEHYSLNATNAEARVNEHCDAATRALIDEAYADDVKLWRGELPPAEKTTLTDLF